MLNDLLFEIKCAEEIGAFKIADNLDKKLQKFAAQSHNKIIKQITKAFSAENGVKNVNYSLSQKKFIVEAEAALPNSVKKEIKNIAEPYTVSFRYSQKSIDELVDNTPDPIERHQKQFNPFGDYITLKEFEDIEPSDKDLDMEEVPEELSDDPSSLDQFLLEEARRFMKKHHGI
jgi:hypothetical protein